MATYNLIKTINGQTSGRIIESFNHIEDAIAELTRQMSFCESDYTGFCADEAARQGELTALAELAAEGLDVTDLIEEVNSWSLPCLFDQATRRELATITDLSFDYDNYTFSITKA